MGIGASTGELFPSPLEAMANRACLHGADHGSVTSVDHP